MEAAENRISAPTERQGGARREGRTVDGCVAVETEALFCSPLLLLFPEASSHSCALIVTGRALSVDGEEEVAEEASLLPLLAAEARGANHSGIEISCLIDQGK